MEYRFEIQRYLPYEQEGKKWQTMVVSPIYGEDTKLSIEREEGERYCRYDIDGEFTFVGENFGDMWDGVTHGARFNIYRKGNPDILVASAPFVREDLDYDWDNEIATLKLKGKDQYEDFLEKMDAEYDLVQLAPPRQAVDLKKRAFLQAYALGDTKITNIYGNMEYEVDAESGAESKTPSELSGLGFTLASEKVRVDIKTDPSWGLTKYDGVYIGSLGDDYIYRTDGQTRLAYGSVYYTSWNIEPKTGPVIGEGTIGLMLYPNVRYKKEALDYETSSGMKHGGSFTQDNYRLYVRVVHDNEQHNQTPIGNNDIWHNKNYRYYEKIPKSAIKDNFVISEKVTNVPNKWMQDDNGMYFVPPQPRRPTERVVAIGWSRWIPFSMWLKNDVMLSNLVSPFDADWTLRDAYGLKDSISVLLGKIDKTMTIKSEFIDNDGFAGAYNPYLGGQRDLWLFITPITNVKKTYYSNAAQKGKISLKQILDMLRQCFNCYWFLEWSMDHWQLRIEHAEWFSNGGSYDEVKPAYADFAEKKSRLSGNPWITGQNKMSYELGEVKSRYEFEWGDKSTALFNGFPINVRNGYAKGRPTEKDKIANFVADVDMVQSSPESVSDDIFMLLGASRVHEEGAYEGDHYIVKYEQVGNESAFNEHPVYLPQNSYLCGYFLEQTFLNYEKPDLMELELEPTYDEQGNKHEVDVPLFCGNPQRIVKQSLAAPFLVDRNDLCPQKIETGDGILLKQGLGQIEKITQNLYAQSAEIELLFEPNRDY